MPNRFDRRNATTDKFGALGIAGNIKTETSPSTLRIRRVRDEERERNSTHKVAGDAFIHNQPYFLAPKIVRCSEAKVDFPNYPSYPAPFPSLITSNFSLSVSPFGVVLQERDFSSSAYRYTFQNQEHDDELKGEGNSINFTYRMHDPRLGRFFAMDPISKEYPWNSSYAFSENDVIRAMELEGAEKLIVANNISSYYNLVVSIVLMNSEKLTNLAAIALDSKQASTQRIYVVKSSNLKKNQEGETRNLVALARFMIDYNSMDETDKNKPDNKNKFVTFAAIFGDLGITPEQVLEDYNQGIESMIISINEKVFKGNSEKIVAKRLSRVFFHELFHAKKQLLKLKLTDDPNEDHKILFDYTENKKFLDMIGINQGYSPPHSFVPSGSLMGMIYTEIDAAISRSNNTEPQVSQ